jgi:hypothetical protein
MPPKFIQNNENDIIEDILKYRKDKDLEDYSLSEVIIDFCESNNLDIEDVGAKLKSNRDFIRTLLEDCIKNNIIQGVVKKNPSENLENF